MMTQVRLEPRLDWFDSLTADMNRLETQRRQRAERVAAGHRNYRRRSRARQRRR